jgi:hypothetical protein
MADGCTRVRFWPIPDMRQLTALSAVELTARLASVYTFTTNAQPG